MVKMTFTLDAATVDVLRKTAERVSKPQSVVVREAIREYGTRAGRLSHEERRRMLETLDSFAAQPATRTTAAVDRELRTVRAARRQGGRRPA
ncbi:MAG: hypothetical protein ABL986_17660 [Vicinamibacterales bacterium]